MVSYKALNTYEKSVGVLQSPVPRTEAFALPIVVRTSNAEAHADMYTPYDTRKTIGTQYGL